MTLAFPYKAVASFQTHFIRTQAALERCRTRILVGRAFCVLIVCYLDADLDRSLLADTRALVSGFRRLIREDYLYQKRGSLTWSSNATSACVRSLLCNLRARPSRATRCWTPHAPGTTSKAASASSIKALTARRWVLSAWALYAADATRTRACAGAKTT